METECSSCVLWLQFSGAYAPPKHVFQSWGNHCILCHSSFHDTIDANQDRKLAGITIYHLYFFSVFFFFLWCLFLLSGRKKNI